VLGNLSFYGGNRPLESSADFCDSCTLFADAVRTCVSAAIFWCSTFQVSNTHTFSKTNIAYLCEGCHFPHFWLQVSLLSPQFSPQFSAPDTSPPCARGCAFSNTIADPRGPAQNCVSVVRIQLRGVSGGKHPLGSSADYCNTHTLFADVARTRVSVVAFRSGMLYLCNTHTFLNTNIAHPCEGWHF